MDDKENKELITRMAETLREHSTPYKEGSWERFKGLESGAGKRVVLFWYWSGAAAIVLLGITLFLFKSNFTKNQAPVIQSYAPQQEHTDGVIPQQNQLNLSSEQEKVLEKRDESERLMAKRKPLTMGKPTVEKRRREEENSNIVNTLVMQKKVKEKKADELGREPDTLKSKETLIAQSEPSSTARGAEKTKPKEDIETSSDALLRMLTESDKQEQSMAVASQSTAMSKRWDFGIVVSPSLSNERVNMGGGVSVAYRISKKVSIGSGMSLVDLGFKANASVTQPPATAALSSASPMLTARSAESSELTSINTNVLALDVPVNIKYHVTNRFYASAGFSLFAVLNEDRTNNYITRTPSGNTSSSLEGYTLAEPKFQVMSTSEKASELPLQGNSYSGFLNFSVGRQLPLSEKVNLSVEPFFKLPVGQLSKQPIDFKYGGLRIITSF